MLMNFILTFACVYLLPDREHACGKLAVYCRSSIPRQFAPATTATRETIACVEIGGISDYTLPLHE